MSRKMLLVTIGAAVLAVAALAVLTPTVIVTDDHPERAAARAARPLAPLPREGLPGLPQGPLRTLGDCLRKHGLQLPRQGTAPDLKRLRDALRACRAELPGDRYRP